MRVRIFKPAKTAMQSRCACQGKWRIEVLQEAPRHTNPVTGWIMADDAVSSLCGRMTFSTSGEALTFARSRGWDFQIDKPNERNIQPKSYLDNFNPDRRRAGR